MKNRYGVTPWGSWFIDVLDSYKMGARLDRGRTYANTGRVLSLEFKNGTAAAKVEGNYRPFYKVEITFPPLKEKEEVFKLIQNDPSLLAQIAAGELPEFFIKKLKNKGIDLIPKKWRDMKRSCNCPDYGDPCKHMAALYYIIAREIDSDPHVLFRLRGIDLSEKFGTSVVQEIEPPFTVKYINNSNAAASNQRFARHSVENDKLIDNYIIFENIPHCAELISALLPPSPPFCARDFSQVMAEFYHYFSSYMEWEYADEKLIEDIEHKYSRSVWTVICPNPAPGADIKLQAMDINGKIKQFSPHEAFLYFRHFLSDDGTESYTFLFYLFKYLNLICSAGAFIPSVLVSDKNCKIIWQPFNTLPQLNGMLEAIASRECEMLTVKTNNKNVKTVSGRSVVSLISSSFLNEWVRQKFLKVRARLNKFGTSDEYRELLNLFFQGFEIDTSAPAQRSLPSAINRWLSVLHIQFDAYKYSLIIKTKNINNTNDNDLRFSLFMEVLSENADGKIIKTPLNKCNELKILRAPTALSNYLPEIRDLFKKQSVELSEARLVAFMDSSASLLTRLGITVILPRALHKELKPRLLVKSNAKSGSLVRHLDLHTLQDFEWQIAIGDQILTSDEFKKLVKQKKAIIRFKEGFVKINPEEFSRLLKKAADTQPDFNDFIKAHFTGDTVMAFDSKETINNLFKEQNLAIPKTLEAKLRPYQKTGYNWICSLLLSGFGCILADDMGLGKTIQSITSVLRLKEEGLLNNGCLVIAPASLLGNWEKELARFAPSLKVSRYHGSGRKLNRKYDIFLTTYQTAARDSSKLTEEAFSLLLADEAHLMKNADTRISRAVKQMRSQYRLALSGTPVENRLEDLRSLFDFILPGYLGTQESFKKQYRIPIEVMRNAEQAESLRKITQPFLLRRLKTDKTIIKDLPEKIVINEYAVLEKEQAALYENIVSESINKTEHSDAKTRSALILNMLTSLKQICNHPRVYDKESPAVSSLSGKAQLLLTLLREILVNREKTLIFSQYVETLDCLECIIKKELEEAPLIFHGGLNQNKRTEIINKFQTDPACRILLVSLKAGGLGLNLTAANRVIHYDLWYNPAVENQATDRAFRIGQKRNVFVHRFITKNSFEEKIDAMISSKKELADMTVASGESWIAKMSQEELRQLFDRQDTAT